MYFYIASKFNCSQCIVVDFLSSILDAKKEQFKGVAHNNLWLDKGKEQLVVVSRQKVLQLYTSLAVINKF